MRTTALIVTLASALSATLSAQIPERAQWEITFARVEASAGLLDMRAAGPETFEARLMQRPWSAVAPLPFLRLVRIDGKVRAQWLVYWASNRLPPGHQPEGAGVVCQDGVCVRPIDVKGQQNWEQIVASLISQNACPIESGGVCGDCDQIWIKAAADGKYREQSCQVLGADSAAGALLQLMKRSARAAGY
jgi:hypothetical protein